MDSPYFHMFFHDFSLLHDTMADIGRPKTGASGRPRPGDSAQWRLAIAVEAPVPCQEGSENPWESPKIDGEIEGNTLGVRNFWSTFWCSRVRYFLTLSGKKSVDDDHPNRSAMKLHIRR